DRHNTVPGVEFPGRRFTRGRALWRPNVAAWYDAVHISCRDCTFRYRGANRDEALVERSVPRSGTFGLVRLRTDDPASILYRPRIQKVSWVHDAHDARSPRCDHRSGKTKHGVVRTLREDLCERTGPAGFLVRDGARRGAARRRIGPRDDRAGSGRDAR